MLHHSQSRSRLWAAGLPIAVAIGMMLLSGCTASPTPTLVPTFTPRLLPSPTPPPSPTAMPTASPTVGPETENEAQPATYGLLIGREAGFVPTGLTVDQDNNLYVIDALNNRILKYDSTGQLLSQWGNQGTQDGQFNFAQEGMPDTPLGDLAVDGEGNVYVVDYGNHRVQKFDKDGQFLTKWGTQGSAESQFDSPGFIAVNSQGEVFVSELGNARVQKFDASGTFLTQLQDLKAEGEWAVPAGIAIDGYDNLYVIVQGPNHILMFSNSDNFIKKLDITQDVILDPIYQPAGIAVDEQNNFVITDYHNGTVRRIDDGGLLLAQFPGSDAEYAQLVHPWDVSNDDLGNVYVTDPVQGVVLKIQMEPSAAP
jgi:tripartite motif-containing protein 71